MYRNRIGWLAAMAAIGAFALAFGAQASLAQGNDASPADKKFVKEAMQGGMAEIQLGQLATQKGQSGDVKQFAQKMVDDHTRLNEQMAPVASQLGITPPTSLDPKHQAIQTRLSGLSGDEFDKAYIKAMVRDHQKDSAEFRKEASTGSSSAVKDAASQGSTVISEHLKMIQQIAQSHGVSASTKAATASPAQQ